MSAMPTPTPSSGDFFDAIFPPPMSAALLAYVVLLQRYNKRKKVWLISLAIMVLACAAALLPLPRDISNILFGFSIGVIGIQFILGNRYQKASTDRRVAQARINEWYGIPLEVAIGITIEDAYKRIEDARTIEFMNCPAGENGSVFYGTAAHRPSLAQED